MNVDITSIGGAAYDVFVRADHTIGECEGGEKQIQFPLGAKIKVKSVVQSCGGGATNTSVGFSRLGLNARFCGIVGNDEWGQNILKHLEKEGVLTDSAIVVEDEISSFSIILVDAVSGKRTILYSPNVNAHMCDPVFPREILRDSSWIFLNHLSDVSCVILDDLLELVQRKETKFAWNPGGSQIRDGFKDQLLANLLKQTDILFLNSEEAKKFTQSDSIEDALKKGTQAGVKVMCITDGSNGASITDGKTVWKCVPEQEIKVVDTTGAGDSFATGVTWAIVGGRDLSEALRVGMINSASVIGKVGTQEGLLTETEISKRLSSSTHEVTNSSI